MIMAPPPRQASMASSRYDTRLHVPPVPIDCRLARSSSSTLGMHQKQVLLPMAGAVMQTVKQVLMPVAEAAVTQRSIWPLLGMAVTAKQQRYMPHSMGVMPNQ